MKLVLIQPPIQDFYDTVIRLQPLGLAYLKASVKRHLPDWEVAIKDFHQGWSRRTISWPQELFYLRDYYPWPDQSPFSLFHHYYHFGAPFETIAEETALEKPDLVGISSLFSPYYREVLKCAEAIKSRLNCPIVLGGSHISAAPEMMLRHPAVDWVIRGEGEKPLVELIRAWQRQKGFEQVPNLGYKKDNQMIFNPLGDPYPLEDLSLPDFSDLDQEKYRYEKCPLCFIISSRGCPHRCSFCSVHSTFRHYQQRPVGDVLEEIRLRHRQGYRVFDFEDDNLTYHREAMIALCRSLIQAFPPGEIELLAMNGISYESLDAELLGWMKVAGFTHLNLSLVSADALVRKKNRRSQGLERYLNVVGEAARLEFKMVSYQILGLPEESLDSMLETLRLNAQLPVLLGASPFYLTPGTPIAETFPPRTGEDLFKARLTAMALETDHCKREDLYTLFVTTRIINFFKGLRFKEDLIRMEEALRQAREEGKRPARGAAIFEALFKERRLYAATKEGFKVLPRFQSKLFFNFWSRLSHIRTQEGKIIRLKDV